jgi:uncharacterized protein YcbK (DUF882 family)
MPLPKRFLLAALIAAGLGTILSTAGPVLAKDKAETRPAGGGPRTHTVYEGQTLGRIAKRYNVSVESICRFNKLPARGARIKPGQQLLIPNPGEDAPPVRTGSKWQDFVEPPLRRGVIVLEAPTQKWRGIVFSPRARIYPKARDGIERVLASWRTGKRREIDAHLIQLIVKMSDTFGGRPLRVVSGYREHSFADESKHKIGRAFDFSIPGIPNALVRDYLRTLTNVGVGYYPNSTHLHVDVRDVTTYWVDNSAPGEAPRYAGRKAPLGPGESEIEEPAGAATETAVEGAVHEDGAPTTAAPTDAGK